MKFSINDPVRALILIAGLVGSIVLTANFSYSAPAPKQFSFAETVPSIGSSIYVSGVAGRLVETLWSQPQVRMNGSIVVSGEGASPNNVRISEQYVGGTVSFSVTYDDNTLGRTYRVDLYLYLPASANFSRFQICAVGGSLLQLDLPNATYTQISTQAGSIDTTISPVARHAQYFISSNNGGSVKLRLPASSSFELHAYSEWMGQTNVTGFKPRCNYVLEPTTPTYSLSTGAYMTCGDQSAYISVSSNGYPSGNIDITSL